MRSTYVQLLLVGTPRSHGTGSPGLSFGLVAFKTELGRTTTAGNFEKETNTRKDSDSVRKKTKPQDLFKFVFKSVVDSQILNTEE